MIGMLDIFTHSTPLFAKAELFIVENGIQVLFARKGFFLLTQLFNAVSTSSIFLLIGLGLAITFGLMGVINMAHGEFIMLGCYTTYVMQQYVFGRLFCGGGCGGKEASQITDFSRAYFEAYPLAYNLTYIITIVGAFVVAGCLGILLERVIVKRLYGRSLDTLMATWGFSLILQQAVRMMFGAQNVDVNKPSFLGNQFRIPGTLVTLPFTRIFILVVAILVLLGLFLFLSRSRFGLRIRAVTQNRAMAACMGIPTQQVDALSFGIGSGLAGICGALITLIGSVGPSTGQNLIVDSFMVVVIGGVGKLIGTLAGATILGFLTTFNESLLNGSLGKALTFAIVILVLQFKPAGLFPQKGRDVE
ncbi:MAG: urea ABC transporter permease subunit UrtB [Cyanobacteriota bacterium]|nr:urea ABC transporter permease subunit UrtB [Cyanobacteriota bacterium]